MMGIACIFISCCLFIHLGLGDTLGQLFDTDFVLFRCVKCLTFWCVLGYSLTVLSMEQAVCAAFLLAYASLWVELLLGKIAGIYEKLSKDVAAAESKSDSGIRSEAHQDNEGKEGFVSEM